jgi:hypothetical protein
MIEVVNVNLASYLTMRHGLVSMYVASDKNLHVEATLDLLQNRIVSAQPAFFSGMSFALSAHKQFRTTICGSCTVGIHSTSHCTSELV